MKRHVCLAITILLLFVLCFEAYAKEPEQKRYDEYLQYLEEGWFEEDVTYEQWITAVEESELLEAYLEEAESFGEFTCVGTIYGDDRSGNEPPTGDGGLTVIKGDILVTNGTSSCGIVGHAGIATSTAKILHIAGSGCHPEYITTYAWMNTYCNSSSKWTKVYRHNSYSRAVAAANWGVSTYINSGATFSHFTDLNTTDKTYCSKIVWQCYYYGPSSHQAIGADAGYVLPYQLKNRIKSVTLERKVYGTD